MFTFFTKFSHNNLLFFDIIIYKIWLFPSTENMKKVYESKKIYSDKYNKSHKSIRITKELYEELKTHIDGKNLSIKDYIENLIKESLK